MTIKHFEAARKTKVSGLGKRLIYLELAYAAKSSGYTSTMSYEDIAELCQCSHPTVQRAIQNLEKEGHIERHQLRTDGRHLGSRYKVILERGAI